MPWRIQLSLLLATPENGFSSTSSTSSIAFRNEEREPAWTVACCCAGESSMALTCWCEACVSWSAANMAKPATTRRLTTSATHLRTPSTTTLKIGRPWSRLEPWAPRLDVRGNGRERARAPDRGAARARAGDRRGHAHQRRHRAVLRGRQAGDPAAGRFRRPGRAGGRTGG